MSCIIIYYQPSKIIYPLAYSNKVIVHLFIVHLRVVRENHGLEAMGDDYIFNGRNVEGEQQRTQHRTLRNTAG